MKLYTNMKNVFMLFTSQFSFWSVILPCYVLSGAFAKLRKATITFVFSVCLSVRPSVRLSAWNTRLHWKDFHEILCDLLTCLFSFFLSFSTVLLEKLTGSQPVKKFPAFYGTRRFITALTSARHLSVSWASSSQSIHPHPTSWISILMLSSHLCLFIYHYLSKICREN